MYSVVPIPAFNDNYIWALTGSRPGLVAVVDPGDAAPVERYLEEQGSSLAAILITHHHHDHTGGVESLISQRDVPVYGPAQSPFEGITHALGNGDRIELLGNRLEVRAVPGHTLDHISYFQPQDQPQLFCGDTLFLAGCGRLFEGTAEQMLAAMDYFSSLPDDTLVYCTHEYSLSNLAFAEAVEGDNRAIADTIERCKSLRNDNQPTLPSTIGSERAINPFMRTAQSDVISAARTHAGVELKTPVEVLATLREWKNRF